MTLFVAPLTKLIAGRAEVFTVRVTTLDVALAILDAIGQVFVPSVTYAIRLKAVVVEVADGSKFNPVAPGISAKLPP